MSMSVSTFQNNLTNDSPGIGSSQVSPSDTDNYTHPTSGEARVARRLVVFGAGTVKFRGLDGVDTTWTIPSGALPYTIDVATVRVWSTGTGATPIFAIW